MATKDLKSEVKVNYSLGQKGIDFNNLTDKQREELFKLVLNELKNHMIRNGDMTNMRRLFAQREKAEADKAKAKEVEKPKVKDEDTQQLTESDKEDESDL